MDQSLMTDLSFAIARQRFCAMMGCPYPDCSDESSAAACVAEKDLITAAPAELGTYLFFRHGIFIRSIKLYPDYIHIEFNEAKLRFDQNKDRKGAVPVQFTGTLYWKGNNGGTLACDTYSGSLDYKRHTGANISYRRRLSDHIQLEIRLDGHLVYQNIFDIGSNDILF